jgi:organic hydroperoxide reductase OsmC/OhrA
MAETFHTRLVWTGVARDLDVTLGERVLPMSSAPAYSGDPARLNPEQLYVAALSACQALTFLAVAARQQISIAGYADDAEGVLERVDGRLRMSRVVLRPRITLEGIADDPGAEETVQRARELVERAHRGCFIANSVTARIEIEPSFEFAEAARLT